MATRVYLRELIFKHAIKPSTQQFAKLCYKTFISQQFVTLTR